MVPRVDGRRDARCSAVVAAAHCLSVALALPLVGCGAGTDAEDVPSYHSTWMNYGGGPDQSRYTALTQIDKSNVDQLEVAWFYPTRDNISYPFSPIVAHGIMYVLAKNNSLVALDAETGEEIWIHANLRGLPRRGLNYWESEDGSDRRILIQINDYLQAIDARTGQSILTFGDNGLVDLRQGLDPHPPEQVGQVQSSTPGTIFENLIIVGSAPGENYMSAPGHVRAFDVVTGELVWMFHTIPQPGEFGYDTWPPEAYRYIGGANVWGEISVDTERGIAYLPVGSPTYDFYGADRKGANLFGNSIVAVNARTGERIWHYQLVHHDLRDHDPSAAPQLITVNHDGREIDAVAVATKQSYLFVFNRVTGEPLWPIEERPVPQSDVPGEESWPTQPHPTKPPPFARLSMTSADLSPFLTEQERAEWAARIDSLVARGRMGVHTPLSHTDWTIAIPGPGGGTNFGQVASDPYRGRVYIVSKDWPSFYEPMELRLPTDAPPAGGQGGGRAGGPGGGGMSAAEYIALGRQVYARECQACHGENRMGMGAAPSLLGIETRMPLADLQALLRSGRSEMPSFPHLSDAEIQGIYRFFGGNANGTVVELPEGPVVASGGAPGGLLPRPTPGGGGRYGRLYPDDAGAPVERYFIRGYGQEYGHVISPPWSSLVAYDLNNGEIAWSVPLGEDKVAAELGGSGTGVPETVRNGIVVTATGLVFSNAKDGRIYAFDADNGEVLWSYELPMGSEGGPAMYEVNGRQYLVVTATTPIVWSRRTPEANRGERGYVVFALPQ